MADTQDFDFPWFPFWASDFLGSRKVRTMTPEEVGIYILLLSEEWVNGPLPDDVVELAMLANGADSTTVQRVLERAFVSVQGRWQNPRLEQIRSEQIEKREQRVRAGIASGKSRRRNKIRLPNDRSTDVQRTYEQTLNEPESEPDKEKNTSDSVMEVFDYWREKRAQTIGKEGGPKMKPTATRTSKVNARLKEGYTVEDLKRAVDGCLGSQYNVENGYMDLELICRDQQHVEQYLVKAKNGGSKTATYDDPSRRRL